MTRQPSPIALQKHPPRLADVDPNQSFTGEHYHSRLKHLQHELLRIQQAYFHERRRAIVVFEGWDASGKGGAIRRLVEKLDPRGFRVHPIAAPSPEEQGRHYLYRFYCRLPQPGSLAIFDRSWYGRVLVERVEQLASPEEWQRAYREINEFERWLTDDGVRIIKLFLHIDADEQRKRFSQRLRDPVKRWKLTEEDLRNRKQWPQYIEAIDDMFQHTSTEAVPWHVIGANRKWFARISSLQIIVDTLAEGVDLTPPPLDEALIRAAHRQLGFSTDEG